MSPGCRACSVSRGGKIWLLIGIILTGVSACGSHSRDSATSSARFSYSSSIQTQLGCSLFRRNIRFAFSAANIAAAAAAAAQTSLLMTRGIPVCTRALISDHISNCQAVVILQDSCTSKPKGFEHLVESRDYKPQEGPIQKIKPTRLPRRLITQKNACIGQHGVDAARGPCKN